MEIKLSDIAELKGVYFMYVIRYMKFSYVEWLINCSLYK